MYQYNWNIGRVFLKPYSTFLLTQFSLPLSSFLIAFKLARENGIYNNEYKRNKNIPTAIQVINPLLVHKFDIHSLGLSTRDHISIKLMNIHHMIVITTTCAIKLNQKMGRIICLNHHLNNFAVYSILSKKFSGMSFIKSILNK